MRQTLLDPREMSEMSYQLVGAAATNTDVILCYNGGDIVTLDFLEVVNESPKAEKTVVDDVNHTDTSIWKKIRERLAVRKSRRVLFQPRDRKEKVVTRHIVISSDTGYGAGL